MKLFAFALGFLAGVLFSSWMIGKGAHLDVVQIPR